MNHLLHYNNLCASKINPLNNIIFRCGQVLIEKNLNYNKFYLYIA